MPGQKIALEPVDEVRVTVITDNVIDISLASSDVAHRLKLPTEVRLDTPLPIAEHGYSVLLEVRRGDRRTQVLFDTGVSPRGFLYNLDALQVQPLEMQAIIISHGHFDHTMGLLGLADRFGARKVPLVVHPDAYLDRKTIAPNGEERRLPTPMRADFRRENIEIIEEVGPSMLVEGMLLVSGEVERTSGFEPGFPVQWALRDGGWEHDPLVRDDQCAIIHVRDKGLVVVTGCGHAGVINIVRHAQALTGVAGAGRTGKRCGRPARFNAVLNSFTTLRCSSGVPRADGKRRSLPIQQRMLLESPACQRGSMSVDGEHCAGIHRSHWQDTRRLPPQPHDDACAGIRDLDSSTVWVSSRFSCVQA